MNEFFIDVISNASMDIFPNNKLSEFINRLPQKLILDGEWLVALQEIIYPLSSKPMKKTVTYRLSRNNTDQFNVRHFQYNEAMKIEELIENFNAEMKEAYKSENILTDEQTDPPEFKFVKKTPESNEKSKVTIKIGSIPSLKRPVFPWIHEETFTRLLGFDHQNYPHMIENAYRKQIKEVEAPYQPDLGQKSHLVFIYTDVIREHFVGDTFARVLRVIPLNKNTGDTLDHITFTKPYYYPVRMNTIEDISIKICDESGENIRFKNGRVFLSLHFKRRETV